MNKHMERIEMKQYEMSQENMQKTEDDEVHQIISRQLRRDKHKEKQKTKQEWREHHEDSNRKKHFEKSLNKFGV